jgi:hypothetical protein
MVPTMKWVRERIEDNDPTEATDDSVGGFLHLLEAGSNSR